MDKVVIYIHGKGGNAGEAVHYEPLFCDCDVVGLDYTAQSPWEAKKEFPPLFDSICRNYKSVEVIANSIGAFFAMNALSDKQIKKVYFISPVVNMEKLITDMMLWANVTEDELRDKKEVDTAFGETLSWKYLCYVREHPVAWTIPTHILYGEKDHLTSYETVTEFAKRIQATLTVMKNGEHWFHTEEQMKFLDGWINSLIDKSGSMREKKMTNKALVVIDLQNDITKNYKEIITSVNATVEWAEKEGLYVVYIRHENITEGTRTFKPGTKGAELVPELKVVSDHIFVKTKSNALTSNDFASFIAQNEITEFVVCGADATACVKSTCFNMRKAGYSVTVISDCVTSYDKKKLPDMMTYYEGKGCVLKTSAEIID